MNSILKNIASFQKSSVCGKYSVLCCIVFIITSLSSSTSVSAQEIDFGQYSSAYSISLSEFNPSEELEFGTLIQNQGPASIDLVNAKVLTLEGVKYLDVLVDITADNYLLLNGDLGCETDPSCRIPFTLEAAYANRGNNNINESVSITVLSNVASAQFQILQRTNGPPGPPPTPVFEGYDPNIFNETAYLYIYGSINIGNVDAGSYSSSISVTINYD
jgi:spore coat protein U-like protein